MYACWENAPYSMGALPEEVQALYLEEHPAYDPARSPANRGFSILTEYLRTWPGAQRSGHPDGSFVAVGTRAATMVADHPLQYGYGPGSPLDKLCRWGGKVLLLGAPLETVTLLHHAEHMADLPEKRVVRYRMPVLREGRRTWVDLEEYDTGRGLVDYPGGDYFAVITRAYLDAGLGASGRVGAADAHLLDAAKLRDFGVAWMEEHLRPLAEAAASRET